MKSRWSRPIVILHWISAIAFIDMFASGLWMVDLTYYSDWYNTAPHWHKSVGLILLAITVIRLVTRVVTSRPPSHGAPFEKRLSHIGHRLLYTLIIALFASGYLISTADEEASTYLIGFLYLQWASSLKIKKTLRETPIFILRGQ